jgi:hypothetical protein
MKPSDSVIVFDTMYIGSTKADTLIIYNGTATETLDLNIKNNVKDSVYINPSNIGQFPLPPNEKKVIPINYTVRSLEDSLKENVLTITSVPGSKSQSEVSNIDLKTFVAFQQFEIDSNSTMNVNPVNKVGILNKNTVTLLDTISTGNISNSYGIVLRNNGNIQLNIDSVVISGDTNGFLFDFSTFNKNLSPTSATRSSVSFKPQKQPGNWSATLSFYTDLRKRFPDQQLEKDIDIIQVIINGIAKAAKPELVSLPDTCEIIYVSQKASIECNPGCTRTFILKNTGDAELKIDSIVFATNTVEFNTENRKTIIKPGEIDTIKVRLLPGSKAGIFSNILSVFTNTGTFSDSVSFTSIPTSAIITIDTVEASPGDIISIPIKVKSDHLIKAQYFLADFIIPYESRKALRYEGLDLISSAAEKADPKILDTLIKTNDTNKSERLISFGLEDVDLFNFNPDFKTLGTLKFTYFLNESTVTEVIFSKYKLGAAFSNNVFCDDFFDVTYPSKIIIKAKENSFCADQETLDSFFADIRKNQVSFTAMMPMSGESVVEIQHFVPEAMQTDIALYAVTGEKVDTIFSGIAPTELTKIRHPLKNLPKGVYYCELRTGAFRKTIPIVITQ